MTLSEDDIERLISAVETMETSLAVLADKQSLSRKEYMTDRAARDIAERRFVKLTEAATPDTYGNLYISCDLL